MTDLRVVKELEGLLIPIKKSLVAINKKLGQHDKSFETINQKLEQHDRSFETISQKLNQHDKNFEALSDKLRQHTEALVNIEDTIKIYGDMYQVNNDNAKKLEKRVGRLEKIGGVIPPIEQVLSHF